jgi:hypothetical protein
MARIWYAKVNAFDLAERKEYPMTIELGVTNELCNTQYAPLAALCAHYQQNQVLAALKEVQIGQKKRDFSPTDKLIQVFLSVLAGCMTLSEVNTRLKPESSIAAIWGWDRFADQSCLSRTLDALSLKHLDQLRQATTQIWRAHSRVPTHNWRGYLWIDYDLSSLPCGAQAEKGQKGYVSGKKT